jgi:hypothetical protein
MNPATATGARLDALGRAYNLIRNDGEPDADFRVRIMVFIDSRRPAQERRWAR